MRLENIFALIASGLNSRKQGELDFVIENGGTVLPDEIKSGKELSAPCWS